MTHAQFHVFCLDIVHPSSLPLGCLFTRITPSPASLLINESCKALSMSCHKLLLSPVLLYRWFTEQFIESQGQERWWCLLRWRLEGPVFKSTSRLYVAVWCSRMQLMSDMFDLIVSEHLTRWLQTHLEFQWSQCCWMFGGNLLLQSNYKRFLSKYRACLGVVCRGVAWGRNRCTTSRNWIKLATVWRVSGAGSSQMLISLSLALGI